MYYCALHLWVLEHTPHFFVNCAIYYVLVYIFRELSLKKIYNTLLNNIDMILLRTSYRHGGFLKFYFKLQLSAFWNIHMVKLCHEKMLILRCIHPSKKRNHLQKKINLHPLITLERPDKKLYSLGIILIP